MIVDMKVMSARIQRRCSKKPIKDVAGQRWATKHLCEGRSLARTKEGAVKENTQAEEDYQSCQCGWDDPCRKWVVAGMMVRHWWGEKMRTRVRQGKNQDAQMIPFAAEMSTDLNRELILKTFRK